MCYTNKLELEQDPKLKDDFEWLIESALIKGAGVNFGLLKTGPDPPVPHVNSAPGVLYSSIWILAMNKYGSIPVAYLCQDMHFLVFTGLNAVERFSIFNYPDFISSWKLKLCRKINLQPFEHQYKNFYQLYEVFGLSGSVVAQTDGTKNAGKIHVYKQG